ncbi:hypothetical protein RhiirA5_507286 [Rhizophagus irregularis]|uniref:Uncharacterized protein n=1 Tax=Rhizophagus irregularis TaxID=588596 RepID=A0A2N0NLL2_9GLOM|nr:hypothetical protein RhiirA5_507286 [Rhizophagus irregularis]
MSSSSTIAERLEEYETERLINFLQEDSELSYIELGDGFFMRLERKNITGHLFLKLTRQEFREFEMGCRPALELEDYIKNLCDTPYTLASIFTTVAGNETVLLADEIKKYDTAKLIEFLKGQGLNLVKNDFNIIENKRVDQEKVGRGAGEYGIVSENITHIPQFISLVDSNKAMQCKYISTILHMAVSIFGDLVITPQANIIGEENTGYVDYAIIKIISEMLEEIICITESKQNQATMEKGKVDETFDPDYDYVYGIVSTEDALKDDTELCKSVKRVLEVIVGLLKDRAVGIEEPATKKSCVEEIIKKK